MTEEKNGLKKICTVRRTEGGREIGGTEGVRERRDREGPMKEQAIFGLTRLSSCCCCWDRSVSDALELMLSVSS